jgi:hypothetical protein
MNVYVKRVDMYYFAHMAYAYFEISEGSKPSDLVLVPWVDISGVEPVRALQEVG